MSIMIGGKPNTSTPATDKEVSSKTDTSTAIKTEEDVKRKRKTKKEE